MKVLFISRRFYPDIIGGGQISAYYIAKAVRDRGHEVYALTFTTGGYKEEEIGGVKIYRYPIFYVGVPLLSHFLNLEGMYVQMAYRSYKFVKEFKPDVVHFLNLESMFIMVCLLKWMKIPSFATVNGPWLCYEGNSLDYSGKTCITCSPKKMFLCAMKKGGRIGLLRRLGRFVQFIYGFLHMEERKYFVRRVDELFPVSESVKTPLVKGGFSADRMKVIHTPFELHEKAGTGLKERLGISGKKVVLYAGRLTWDKGVDKLVDAMRFVDGAVLLVVGRGRSEAGLKKQVEKYGLGGKVIFAGFMEHSKVPEYYSIADLVVLPGTYYEPLSRMLLEACSYGIPVIATNVGGNPEIVEDKRNGILLNSLETRELADAVKYILENPKIYKEMSDYCREKIKRDYSPEKVGKELVEAYERHLK